MKKNFVIQKKYMLLMCIAISLFSALKAQNKYPPRLIEEPKRKSCYIYSLHESPFGTGVKVMLISTYIYRQKYEDYDVFDDYGNASRSYFANLGNCFNKKLEDIEYDERYYTTLYGKVSLGQMSGSTGKTIESYWSQFGAGGFCPTSHLNQPTTHQSATDYAEDCRTRFIDEKRKEGYKVFQVTCDQYYEKSILDLFTETEFNASVDEVRPLSTMYVEQYHPGIIKDLSGWQKKESSSSSSESKKSKTSSDEKKETTEEFEARMNLYRSQALSLETKGDEYYKLGSMFYKQAYDCYKASYNRYPLPSVQKKLSDIEAMMRVAKSVDEFGKKVDDFVFSMDPEGKTNYTHGFVQYNGFMGSKGPVNSFNKYRVPTDVWFGITGQRLFLSYQVRMGYIQTGNAEIKVNKEYKDNGTGSWNKAGIVDTVLVNNAGFGLGMSGGINIPIQRFQIYGLYGFDMRVGLAGNIYSDAFDFEEKKDGNDLLPMFQTHLELGVLWLIPKTKMGLGLNYNMLTMRTTSNTDIKNTSLQKLKPTADDAAGKNRYYLDSFINSKNKYGTLGIKFFWMLN